VPADFAHPLPDGMDPLHTAPLLCAGAVGLRAIRLCDLRDGETAGLTGFGASGHIVLPMLRHLYPGSHIVVFARNHVERAFAMELGADWAGDTQHTPPWPLDAVIDTTPAWTPVLAALERLAPGGRLVINAIAKESGDKPVLLDLDYPRQLWREKVVRSVTNVTRADVREALALAVEIPLRPEVTPYPFEAAPRALLAMRAGGGRGARVLMVD
jgi:propanol-preferring alcohol dehydrogenase